jgi:carbon monoxide dehydrogenase subunit G
MDNTHELVIDQPMSVVWPALTDLRCVAAALPGAGIEDSSADGWYDGLFRIKLGAFNAAFRGRARYLTVDDDAHRFVLEGTGGSAHGDASLSVECQAEEHGADRTHVRLTSSINLTGRLAQFGSSMADGVLRQLMDAFAANLASSFSSPDSGALTAKRAEAGPATALPSAPAADAFSVGGSLLAPVQPYLPALVTGLIGAVVGLLLGRLGRSPRETRIVVHLSSAPR